MVDGRWSIMEAQQLQEVDQRVCLWERTFSQEKQCSQAALLCGVDWKFAALLSDWKAQAGHFYACHLALPGNSRPNHYENNTQENQKNPIYRNFKSESIQSRVSILSLVVECFIESIFQPWWTSHLVAMISLRLHKWMSPLISFSCNSN